MLNIVKYKLKLKYRIIPIRMIKILKMTIWGVDKDVDEADPTFVPCWSECKIVPPLWEVASFLSHTYLSLLDGSAISLLGIYPEENKSEDWT